MKRIKYSPSRVKRALKEARRSDADIVGHYVLDEDRFTGGYVAAGFEGDLIVTFCGRDPGSVGWEENLGSVLNPR